MLTVDKFWGRKFRCKWFYNFWALVRKEVGKLYHRPDYSRCRYHNVLFLDHLTDRMSAFMFEYFGVYFPTWKYQKICIMREPCKSAHQALKAARNLFKLDVQAWENTSNFLLKCVIFMYHLYHVICILAFRYIFTHVSQLR